MDFLNFEFNSNYIEIFGAPGSGKTTLCKKIYDKNKGKFILRGNFFKDMSFIVRYSLFLLLSIRYGFFYLYVALRYFGLKSLALESTQRGYFDYLAVKYYLRSKNNYLLYDQGIISTAVSIAWRMGSNKDKAWLFVKRLLPTKSQLIRINIDNNSVVERSKNRSKIMPHQELLSEYDRICHFAKINSYLDYFFEKIKNEPMYLIIDVESGGNNTSNSD